jgi:O-antigen ligase
MLLAETGIPATLLLYLSVGWVCYRGVNHLNPLQPLRTQTHLIPLMLLLAFAATTLFHLIDVTLFDARINTLGWLLLAAIDQGEPLPNPKNPEAKTSG